MPYTTLVAGTTITASWANASVRDQVVTPFASAAARSSAITAPITGMVSYRTDVKRLEVYDGATWEPMQTRVQARKVADTTVTNTTTLASDPELLWAVQANATYTLDLHMRYLSGAVPDAKIGWSYPAGAGMAWNLIANDTSLVATITGDYDITTVPALGGNGTFMWAHACGMLITSTTAGTLTLQFAQNTANASNTTMAANSFGSLTRLA